MMAMNVSMQEKFDSIDNLPTMPHILQKILDSMDDITASSVTVETIIREDPSIASRVLQMANSPYYGAANNISSIAKAVTMLGFEEIKGLVVGISLTGSFSGNFGFDEFDGFGMWIHSLAVARCAKTISEHVSGTDPDELFTIGLLHDIGRFVMCMYCKEDIHGILDVMRNRGCSLHEAERHYDFPHEDAGAYLVSKWQLSEKIRDVIRYHHHPGGAGPYSTYASIIFLADELCHKLEIGWTMEGMVSKFLVPRELSLSGSTVKNIAAELKASRKEFVEAWGRMLIS